MTLANFTYHDDLIEEIASRFDLRTPNRRAFEAAIAALAGGVDPQTPMVLSVATGVGKTFIMAAIIEYLRAMGHTDAIIVTPSTIVQAKTVANFTPGNRKFIEGAATPPRVVTPETYDLFRAQGAADATLGAEHDPLQLFVVNVHQLLKTATKLPSERELNGNIKRYLTEKKDLIVLADEHHLYSMKAKAFNEGIMGLNPAAIIGLTASTDVKRDDVRYRYTLREAIDDKFVKRPVLAFRRGGYGENEEEQQLRDSLALLSVKEQAFGSYINSNPNASALSPVLFVQCADVAHATDITALLSGPEFFDSTRAVLQVDNEHNDSETINRLIDIDSVNSEVRCVVSVNKLKEGWDVKNVAVMVTLRAMASEILTQQTLGRGLRLPFGHITGISHVDQLDIITHESFRQALKKENVLHEFGLEAASKEPAGTDETQSRTPPMTGGTESHTSATSGDDTTGNDSTNAVRDDTKADSRPVALPGGGTGKSSNPSGGPVGMVEFDSDDFPDIPAPPAVEQIALNTVFADTEFQFPSAIMRPVERAFDLTDALHPNDITAAAKKVTDSGAILHREELTFASKRLRTLSEEDVNVGSIRISTAEAREGLTEEVLRMSNFDTTEDNVKALSTNIIPRFVHDTGISDWSIKALDSARNRLRTLIDAAARAHRAGLADSVILQPVTLPRITSYSLPEGESILDRLPSDATSADFNRYRHYGPWTRGLFTAAAFDSYSTEYRIADMLDRSPKITWWTRLYAADRASIAYTATANYNPDFVALATDGCHWIIEGKADGQESDATVNKKREATEKLISRMAISDDFADQDWGYAIAFESDVTAADSWADLITSLKAVRTPRY